YDGNYFRDWASRTASFASRLRTRYPWLMELCARCDEWSAPLLAAPPTVIHGEFYTKNLLLRRRKVYVVDWESSAVGAGEIDLAATTEGGWPRRTVSRCEHAYERAGWPRGAPASFRTTLDAARIYLHFRWLGERSDRTLGEKLQWRYEDLHATAKRLAFI